MTNLNDIIMSDVLSVTTSRELDSGDGPDQSDQDHVIPDEVLELASALHGVEPTRCVYRVDDLVWNTESLHRCLLNKIANLFILPDECKYRHEFDVDTRRPSRLLHRIIKVEGHPDRWLEIGTSMHGGNIYDVTIRLESGDEISGYVIGIQYGEAVSGGTEPNS